MLTPRVAQALDAELVPADLALRDALRLQQLHVGVVAEVPTAAGRPQRPRELQRKLVHLVLRRDAHRPEERLQAVADVNPRGFGGGPFVPVQYLETYTNLL